MTLRPGDPAPPFEVQDQDGQTVRSGDLAGQRYVLYFYPHDDTPVCTKQAVAFEENREALDDLQVPVFGVSPNSVKSHAAFAKKHDIGFRLLADRERKMIKDYDVQGLLGRTSRTTYLVAPDGHIEAVHKAELSGKGHVAWARREVEKRVGTKASTP